MVPEHVAQEESHGAQAPDCAKYPLGHVAAQVAFGRRSWPLAQVRHVVEA